VKQPKFIAISTSAAAYDSGLSVVLFALDSAGGVWTWSDDKLCWTALPNKRKR
jgi:hypothetical protein